MENNITINNRIPQLRFPGYTGDWEEKSLGEVGVFVRGLSYNKGEVTQDRAATLVLRSNNIIQDGAVDCRNGLQFVTKEPSTEQILQKGDIVICLSNGSSNLVGKSANYEGDYAGIATVGAFCGIYRSTAPIAKYLVQTPAYKKSVELIKQGGNGALANLYGRDILGLKFYFPTLEEQNEIVECLEAEDRMIAAQEQKVESLKAHKKGLMQQLFPQPGATTPALRFPGFTGKWQEKKLGEIADVNPKSDKLPNKFVYIDLESVESGNLLKKNIIEVKNAPSRAQRLLKKGDILFQMVRPYQRNNYHFYDNDVNVYVASTGYAQIRYKDCSEYLYQYLHTDTFVDMAVSKCVGGNYPAINTTDLTNITVYLPSRAEQQMIAECLGTLDNLIAAESKKLGFLKSHKKGLMQQLFPQPEK